MSTTAKYLLLNLFLFVLTACGGGGDSDSAAPANPATPSIASFTVSSGIIIEGESVSLSATFSGGTGSINNGVGAIASGAAITISPSASTTYTLTVTNTAGSSVTRSVTVTVNPASSGNRAPVASNSTLLTDEGTTATAQLRASDPDGDTLTFAVTGSTSNGVLQVDTRTGSFDYSANIGSSGADWFTFLVSDGQEDSAEASVSITINRTPVADNDAQVVVEGETLSATVTGSDPDGDAITFSVVTLPTTGTLQLNSQSGVFTFVADIGSQGAESFVFRVSDGRLFSNNGTVAITVNPRLPVEVAKIDDPVGAPNDQFGASVDISGTTAIIGSYLNSEDRQDAGAAFIYSQDAAGGWQQEARLRPNNPTLVEWGFGREVRILGTTALVATSATDNPDSPSDGTGLSGFVYVFEKDAAGQWLQQARLTPSDHVFGDFFAMDGQTVSMSNDAIVVGAPAYNMTVPQIGAAYVFTRNQTGEWVETAKLTSPDPVVAPVIQDNFGRTVVIDGDTIAASFQRLTDGTEYSYGVYLFQRDGAGNWLPTQTLSYSSADPWGNLGNALSLQGDTLLVGVDSGVRCTDQRSWCGSVFAFARDISGTWSQEAHLLSDGDYSTDQGFGQAIALEGNRAIVGARGSTRVASGSVYVFQRNQDGSWSRQSKISASDAQIGDYFGHAVAVSSSLAIVGAHGHDVLVPDSGAAYIIDLR